MARTKKDAEQPVFDYSHYSRQQQKRTMRQSIKMQNLAQRLEDHKLWLNDGMFDDDAFENGLDEFEEIQAEIEKTISKWLVSVPRDWLVVEAPETLDWSDPQSLDWVRADKFSELSQAAAEARAPEKVSGNSAKR